MLGNNLFYTFLLAFCLLCPACEDQDKQYRDNIVGRWELAEGLRDAQPTESLEGTYFVFGADGQMSTSLPVGDGTPTAYTLQKGVVRQSVEPPVDYRIQTCADSLLVLTMQLRGVDFELRLRKAPVTE